MSIVQISFEAVSYYTVFYYNNNWLRMTNIVKTNACNYAPNTYLIIIRTRRMLSVLMSVLEIRRPWLW